MALPHLSADAEAETDAEAEAAQLDGMEAAAREASAFLKTLSHEARLMILCHLAAGEKSVTELEALLALRQAAVSQQLARLRHEGLVAPRRAGKAIYYRLADPRAVRILDVVYDIFCRGASGQGR